MDCRKTSLQKFRTKLRFRQYDVILAKDKSVLTKIKSYFERENMQAQYNVLSYRITLFCHGYKVAIKIDETGHSDTEILITKQKDKKQQNKNLVVSLLQLILTKKTLIFLKLSVKYLDTSNN